MALENARLYDEIRHQALHDGLTGLANRVLFRDRVIQALERSRGREGRPFADPVHRPRRLQGPQRHAGARARRRRPRRGRRSASRPRSGRADTAARLGGDEFAVLLDDVGDEDRALSIAIRLADALREPLDLGDASPVIAASIGVALSGTDGETADDLLRNADVAMYAAKSSSRGRAELFRSALRAEAAARSDLAALLRGVDQRGELRLDYQPIVELATGAVVGLEALVRWQLAGSPVAHADAVHRPRRGDRRHRADGPLDPPRGVPPDARVAAPARAAGPRGQRQPVGPPVPGTRPRRVGPVDPRGNGPARLNAHPRDHREQPHAADGRHDRPARRAALARHRISRSTTSGPATPR